MSAASPAWAWARSSAGAGRGAGALAGLGAMRRRRQVGVRMKRPDAWAGRRVRLCRASPRRRRPPHFITSICWPRAR